MEIDYVQKSHLLRQTQWIVFSDSSIQKEKLNLILIDRCLCWNTEHSSLINVSEQMLSKILFISSTRWLSGNETIKIFLINSKSYYEKSVWVYMNNFCKQRHVCHNKKTFFSTILLLFIHYYSYLRNTSIIKLYTAPMTTET